MFASWFEELYYGGGIRWWNYSIDTLRIHEAVYVMASWDYQRYNAL